MLRPTKHSHPDQTVVAVALLVLRHLRRKRSVDYVTLRTLTAAAAPGAEFLFLPAVNFLFLLGVLEFRSKTDSFEYVGA